LPKLETCLSPALLHLYDFSNSIVVVIDVFRATSTIASVLHAGAVKIIPTDSVAKCIEIGNSIPNSITAGERDGKIADGLQYGNSPTAYPAEMVNNRVMVLTTTNGTRLLHQAKNSKEIIIGSFLNLQACIDYLLQQNCDVLLACSSWKDRFNIEDTLFAGAVAEAILPNMQMNCDSTRAAIQLWQGAKNNLNEYIQNTSHWHRLSAYGLQQDMLYCVKINAHNVLVKYDGEALKSYTV
jgi:2-phosphosulfolactate phosphatase